MTEPFGTTSDGTPVQRVRIASGRLSAAILTFGAALQDVRLSGVAHSLTVGSPSLAAYEGDMRYCGTVVGPVANRIGGAAARIGARLHRFDANENGNTLHGGRRGTQSRVWTLAGHGPAHAELHLHLPDGDGGFPGNRRLSARYDVDDAALTLTLAAETDAATLMNPANHSYWRLADEPDFCGHRLRIAADRCTPAGPDGLPTGRIAPVAGTRQDFRAERVLTTAPIDLNFCLSDGPRPLRPVAWLTAPSGLQLELATTAPGLQVFDGHILDMPDHPGNDGGAYGAHAGLALEPQSWPDAPNHAGFPQIELGPGQTWQQITRWTFRA